MHCRAMSEEEGSMYGRVVLEEGSMHGRVVSEEGSINGMCGPLMEEY